MYIEIGISKRNKGCNQCGRKMEPGENYLLTTEFITGIQYPVKKSICFLCADKLGELIPEVEALLKCMKVIREKRKESII